MKDAKGKVLKNTQGKEIPEITTPPRGEFKCEALCVEQWEHWCGYAEFEETHRWCEAVGVPVEDDPDCAVLDADCKHNFQIWIRITGWFEMHWRVTCVEQIIPSQEEEIRAGHLPPDGRPRGHYVPPGADPTELPTGIERVPDGCCCEIVAVRPRAIETIIGENVFWGHRFVIDVDYRYRKLKDGESGGDCSLKWWEFTDNPPPDFVTRYRVRRNAWANMRERIPASRVFRDWLTRNKSCDDVLKTVTLVDEPGLSWPPRFPDVAALQIERNLWIKIELTSGCPPYTTHSVCFYQYLDSRNLNALSGWATMLTPNDCDALDPEAEEQNPEPDATPPTPNHDPGNPPNSNRWPR